MGVMMADNAFFGMQVFSYMSATGFVFWLFFTSVFVGLFVSGARGLSDRTVIIGVTIIIVTTASILLYIGRSNSLTELERLAEEAKWVSEKCPIYESECGGKHKYYCERKAATVGRNRVGDVFVIARPTCN